jgi:hypothetical protein
VNPRDGAVLRLGVIIPCRNEGLVIERKLRNVALGRFPASSRPHVIVVVDDGSEDDTIAGARTMVIPLLAAGLELRVVSNTIRPGKPGAIRQGLSELADDVDLVVLTDADVVVDAAAWSAIAQAFESDAKLALACGVQRFVRDLKSDGTCRGVDGGETKDASSAYDRWTARVRALESRFDRLFSVHGQLLAWRATLDLLPQFGVAADDLDLMLQVRSRAQEPRRVRIVPTAPFFEMKAPTSSAASDQALRRARAYFQVLRSSSARGGFLDRWQWRVYRWAPEASPELAIALPILASALVWWVWGTAVALVTLAFVGACALTPSARHARALLRVIRTARALERDAPLPERWEMVRR